MVAICRLNCAVLVTLILEIGVEAKIYEEYESLTKNEVLKWAIPSLVVYESNDFVRLKAKINEYRFLGFRTIYIDAYDWDGQPQELYGFLQSFANGTKFLIEVTPKTEAELGEWLRIGEGQQAISVYFSPRRIHDSSFVLEPQVRSNASIGMFSEADDFSEDLRVLRSFGLSVDKVILDLRNYYQMHDYDSVSKLLPQTLHEFEHQLVDLSDLGITLYYTSSTVPGCSFVYNLGAKNNYSVVCAYLFGEITFEKAWDTNQLVNYSLGVSLKEFKDIEPTLIWQKSDHVMIDMKLDTNILVGQDLGEILTHEMTEALRNTRIPNISFLIHVQEETNSTYLNDIISTASTLSRQSRWQIKSLVLEFPEIACGPLSDVKRVEEIMKGLNTTELKEANIALGFTHCKGYYNNRDVLLPNPNENPYDLVLLQNMPARLREIKSVIHSDFTGTPDFGGWGDRIKPILNHYKSTGHTILIEAYWSPDNDSTVSESKSKLSCYGLKKYWNYMQIWAVERELSLQVDLSPSSRTEVVPWFKNVTYYFNQFEELNSKEREFISNFKDKCVVVDDSPPKQYFNWLGPAGVTFDLTRRPFVSLKPHWLTGFLQLVHFKFSFTELIIGLDNDPMHISESLSRLQGRGSNQTSAEYKQYINLGGLHQVAPKFILNIEPLLISPSVIGAHIDLTLASKEHDHSFGSDVERLNETIAQSQKFRKKFGLVIPYESNFDPKLSEYQTKLFQRVDYVIVDVDVTRILALKQGERNETNLMPEDVYEYGRNYFLSALNYSDFNNIFYDLRGFRFNCKRAIPNITVMLKLSFPVYPERGGVGIFLQFWKFVDDFSATFQFPFFVYEAFDDMRHAATCSSSHLRFGWWTIKNLSHVKDPTTYSEHQSAYFHRPTPFPTGNYTEEPKEKLGPGINIFEIIGPSSVTIAFLLIALPLLYRIRQKSKIISDMEFNEFLWGQCPMDEEHSDTDPIFSEKYDTEKLEVDKHEWCQETSTELGVGNFGIVYKSLMSRFRGPVAVKAPKHSTGLQSELAQQVRSFLCEIKIMSYVGEHENILKLLGAYTKGATKGMVLVITEYCGNGSLLSHLRSISKARSLIPPEVLYNLYRFCQEIATGMEYLRSRNVVHSDLAARNVLLNHNLTCKISDFGLSRQLEKYSLYKKKSTEPLPWAWMPPESLVRMELTPKSDVWSMGVTYFEVFSLGEKPYPTETWNDEFVNKLENGYRLRQPKYATDQVYKEILKCWELEPEDRPTPAHFIPFFHAQKVYGYADVL